MLYIDPFSKYRQPDLFKLADPSQLNPLEVQASAAGLFYVKHYNGGDVGVYGYGAGVAMATLDALKLFGATVSRGLRLLVLYRTG